MQRLGLLEKFSPSGCVMILIQMRKIFSRKRIAIKMPPVARQWSCSTSRFGVGHKEFYLFWILCSNGHTILRRELSLAV